MNHKQDVASLETEVLELSTWATHLVVRSPDEERGAAEFRVKTNNLLKQIEAKRKSYTDNLNATLKAINADFKKAKEPLETAIEAIDSAILAYRQSEPYKAAQEAQRAIEDRAREAVATGDVGTLENLVDAKAIVDAQAPKTVHTESGSLGTRKTWTFEILDEAKVPREFLMVDETRLREAIRVGIRVIDGVRIYQKESISQR